MHKNNLDTLLHTDVEIANRAKLGRKALTIQGLLQATIQIQRALGMIEYVQKRYGVKRDGNCVFARIRSRRRNPARVAKPQKEIVRHRRREEK